MRSRADAGPEELGALGYPLRRAASAQPSTRAGRFDEGRPSSELDTRQHRLIRWTARQLTLVLMFLFFVPMPGSAEDGNALFRLLIMGIAAVAIPGCMERPLLAARLAGRLWPLWLLLSWLLLTSRWASYPDLTLRRGFAYVLIFLIAIALATSSDRPKDFYSPTFKALGAVFVVNLISAQMFAPIDAAMGVNGIYAQKNGAGALALYAIITATAGVVLHKGVVWRFVSLGLALLAWGFLVSTRAKTSIATAGLLTVSLPLLGLLLSRPALHKALAASAFGLLLGSALFVQLFLGVTGEQVAEAIFGDLTFTNRTYIWTALYPEIALHPWTGSGFGSFWSTGELINPITNASPDAFFMAPKIINEAHNGYIDITLQAGYVGLALTTLIILRAVWTLCSLIASSGASKEDRITGTMQLGLVIALSVSNFTESQLFSPSNPIGYMFVVVAVQAERWLLLAAPQLSGRRHNVAPG